MRHAIFRLKFTEESAGTTFNWLMVFVSKVIVFSVNATCSYLSLVLACSLPTSDHFPFACTLLAREIAKVAIPMKILHQAALSVKVADGVRLHPFRSIRRSSP